MKKLTAALSVITLLSISAMAENIDGTLSVDANNALTQTEASANQLSANLNDTPSNGKYEIEAQTQPIPTLNTNRSSYQEGPFVGVEGSAIIGSNSADGLSNSGVSFGLRFGAQNIDWRTMAVLESFGSSDDYNTYVRALLQIDYYFLGSDNLMLDTYAFRPYLGVNAGGLSFDTNIHNVKTLTYGGQIGATMNVTREIDLDIGYRYNLAFDDEVDSMHGISLGVHYKY